ncbi:hypothetical protein AAZX31_14G033500 [Glycine max]|uniref:THAP4-like heme-binding domain-containing protein n=2 Tax=Glycine subgen. Soja TaxID=1462606 RepID=K7M4R1_SOYBN|nr:hypothetical protein JHK86_038885 [Glycine max]KHN12024.1 UPF0678 fatty acid-binding protein-like protein [Glycine soja]KAG4964490.1 hypothetical protein JHK85_039465 [Glycine max]KAG5109482.1 hypothetical protein JHK82_038705 [Glycine max]KAG5120769.1 hypothetical protein JHK84_039109 [Glycine max]
MNAKTKSPAPETSSVVIHPALAPIFYLLSTWRAQGEGCFPTIDSFSYGEELHFSHSPNKSFTSHVPRGRSSGGRWKIATVNESENRSYQ